MKTLEITFANGDKFKALIQEVESVTDGETVQLEVTTLDDNIFTFNISDGDIYKVTPPLEKDIEEVKKEPTILELFDTLNLSLDDKELDKEIEKLLKNNLDEKFFILFKNENSITRDDLNGVEVEDDNFIITTHSGEYYNFPVNEIQEFRFPKNLTSNFKQALELFTDYTITDGHMILKTDNQRIYEAIQSDYKVMENISEFTSDNINLFDLTPSCSEMLVEILFKNLNIGESEKCFFYNAIDTLSYDEFIRQLLS